MQLQLYHRRKWFTSLCTSNCLGSIQLSTMFSTQLIILRKIVWTNLEHYFRHFETISGGKLQTVRKYTVFFPCPLSLPQSSFLGCRMQSARVLLGVPGWRIWYEGHCSSSGIPPIPCQYFNSMERVDTTKCHSTRINKRLFWFAWRLLGRGRETW